MDGRIPIVGGFPEGTPNPPCYDDGCIEKAIPGDGPFDESLISALGDASKKVVISQIESMLAGENEG